MATDRTSDFGNRGINFSDYPATEARCVGFSNQTGGNNAIMQKIKIIRIMRRDAEEEEIYELASVVYDYFEANANRMPLLVNILFYLLHPDTTAVGAGCSYNIPSDLWSNFYTSVKENPNVLYDLRQIVNLIKNGYFE